MDLLKKIHNYLFTAQLHSTRFQLFLRSLFFMNGCWVTVLSFENPDLAVPNSLTLWADGISVHPLQTSLLNLAFRKKWKTKLNALLRYDFARKQIVLETKFNRQKKCVAKKSRNIPMVPEKDTKLTSIAETIFLFLNLTSIMELSNVQNNQLKQLTFSRF